MMTAEVSPVALDVARVAVARGVVPSELRGPRGAWMRERLVEAVGASMLDEAEWSQVMREVSAAIEREARAHRSTSGICRSCGQPVRWVQTVRGKRMPIDPLPTPAGNIVLRASGSQVLAFVHGNQDLPLSSTAFRAHAATCPRTRPALRLVESADERPRCTVCGLLMDPVMYAAGERTHPTCGGDA